LINFSIRLVVSAVFARLRHGDYLQVFNMQSNTASTIAPTSPRILRIPATKAKTGLSRATIYRLLAAGDFPPKIQLSPRTIGFLESDIDQWLADKIAARKAGE
jgi:prophage regulatory protein